ncbi:MAG: ATP-binding cassette domain-containing protein [Gammaproteobacteria bacterium]|nr:ATP-binding cassette domain-containing protein [Gammaproteobacteria bacterium]
MFSLQGVSKSFGGVEVLKDISLTLHPGERLGITGANGVGKSTLINIATGFLTPDVGHIKLRERTLTHRPAWAFAQAGIRRTFQTTRFLATSTLGEQLLLVARTPECRARLVALLQSSGLQSSLPLFADEIPLPMLRKAEVIRGLAAQPEVLFLDEPSAGLTVDELHEFGGFLQQHLHRKTALVVVEHRLDFMTMVTDLVVEMHLNQGLQLGVGGC